MTRWTDTLEPGTRVAYVTDTALIARGMVAGERFETYTSRGGWREVEIVTAGPEHAIVREPGDDADVVVRVGELMPLPEVG